MRAQVPEVSGYVERLNAAWGAHLAQRAADASTVISTFAGCGGSSLGYSMAGFRELLAVEWDDNAVATFRLNFPEVPVYHGDIAALSVDECLRLPGLQPGELDVFDGSPPCQGFSTAGKRMMDDPRNGLFREYVRLLRGLRPKVFVMENVSGMVKGKMKLVFAEILRELKASGYAVSARLMNAMYFDVPQSRERMIFIGVRDDLGVTPSHPRAISKPVILREAIHELGPSKQIPGELTANKIQRWSETKRGDAHTERFSTLRLAWSTVAPTILKTPGSGGHFHPDEPRLLSTGELQRIASFPDQYTFVGDWMASVNRIGNSVPPLFMRAIAEHIRVNLLTIPALHETAAG
ncbi:MAG: DNA cytosine methyltransferase [Thermomicrobiales bacterium]|nr:DNA cytosine methyltransferase [Thermomicrobiales bacterium]